MRITLVAFCTTLLVARSAEAQRGLGAIGPVLAGYRVGMIQVDRRALPCENDSEGLALCQPSSDVWLRFRDSVLIEVSTHSFSDAAGGNVEFAPDAWRRLRARAIQQFGQPDSVRVSDPKRQAPAFVDGLAAYWTSGARGWCAVMTVKSTHTGLAVDTTVELRDPPSGWGHCFTF